jgi:hypothetical protein
VQKISTAEEYSDAITAAADIYYSGWKAKVSASANFARDTMKKTQNLHYMWMKSWTEILSSKAPDVPNLLPAAKGLLSETFDKRYGKYFCGRIQHGGNFVAMFTLSTRDETEKMNIAAQIGGSYSGFGNNVAGSASFGAELQKASQQTDISIKADSSAWNAEKMFAVDNIDEITKAAESYISEHPQGAPLQCILYPFTMLSDYPTETPPSFTGCDKTFVDDVMEIWGLRYTLDYYYDTYMANAELGDQDWKYYRVLYNETYFASESVIRAALIDCSALDIDTLLGTRLRVKDANKSLKDRLCDMGVLTGGCSG